MRGRGPAVTTPRIETSRETTGRGEAARGMSPRSNLYGVVGLSPHTNRLDPPVARVSGPSRSALPSTPLCSGGRACSELPFRPPPPGSVESPLRRHARWRPLPEGVAASLRRSGATRASCSVHVVSHHLDGFLHLRVAGLLHPAADHGVHDVSRTILADHRSPPCRNPSKETLVDSRARITAGRCLLVIAAPSPRRAAVSGQRARDAPAPLGLGRATSRAELEVPILPGDAPIGFRLPPRRHESPAPGRRSGPAHPRTPSWSRAHRLPQERRRPEGRARLNTGRRGRTACEVGPRLHPPADARVANHTHAFQSIGRTAEQLASRPCSTDELESPSRREAFGRSPSFHGFCSPSGFLRARTRRASRPRP